MTSGLSVRLVDVAQVPPAGPVSGPARLNLATHAGDGSDRLFVVDMNGPVHVVEGGSVRDAPFLDVAGAPGVELVTQGLQLGVSTIAFHPDFARAGEPGYGLFYTATSETATSGEAHFPSPSGTTTHHSVLSEWRLDPEGDLRIDPTSRRELLRVAEPSPDHNMGQIAFNPNAVPGDADYGMLYVAMGDGGGYNAFRGDEVDPHRTAQDLMRPFGSILRIDPLGESTPDHPTPGGYGIPLDNPLAGNGDEQLEEIWAHGLRNPHRFSWDEGSPDGLMLISDVGQGHIEEIDIGYPGANYGWSEREGTFVFDHFDQDNLMELGPDDASFGFTYPLAQYDHDEGVVVVGGFVYRGDRVPQLRGKYVFGDGRDGRIFYLDVDDLEQGSQATIYELILVASGMETTLLDLVGGTGRVDLRFGIDEGGEIYVLSKRDGMIRTFVPEPASGALVALGLAALAARRRLHFARLGG